MLCGRMTPMQHASWFERSGTGLFVSTLGRLEQLRAGVCPISQISLSRVLQWLFGIDGMEIEIVCTS